MDPVAVGMADLELHRLGGRVAGPGYQVEPGVDLGQLVRLDQLGQLSPDQIWSGR